MPPAHVRRASFPCRPIGFLARYKRTPPSSPFAALDSRPHSPALSTPPAATRHPETPRPHGDQNGSFLHLQSTPCPRATALQRHFGKQGPLDARPAMRGNAPQVPGVRSPICRTAAANGSLAPLTPAPAAAGSPRPPAKRLSPPELSPQAAPFRRASPPGRCILPQLCGRSSRISRRNSLLPVAAVRHARASPSWMK